MPSDKTEMTYNSFVFGVMKVSHEPMGREFDHVRFSPPGTSMEKKPGKTSFFPFRWVFIVISLA